MDDLAIPDTPCTPRDNETYGYVCPDNMECLSIDKDPSITGYNTFEHFRKCQLAYLPYGIGYILHVAFQP